jgi:hypothetical protein
MLISLQLPNELVIDKPGVPARSKKKGMLRLDVLK